jgi:hypothetical protein
VPKPVRTPDKKTIWSVELISYPAGRRTWMGNITRWRQPLQAKASTASKLWA